MKYEFGRRKETLLCTITLILFSIVLKYYIVSYLNYSNKIKASLGTKNCYEKKKNTKETDFLIFSFFEKNIKEN